MEQIHRSSYIVWSVVGLVIACTVFAVLFFIGNAFLYLLNLLRGAENDWIESAFRELAAPAFGSYAAMIAVHKILKVYSKNFIFFGFSTLGGNYDNCIFNNDVNGLEIWPFLNLRFCNAVFDSPGLYYIGLPRLQE